MNQAKTAAAGKSVGVHGADTIQQLLNAGNPTAIQGVGVTHLRYPVRKV